MENRLLPAEATVDIVSRLPVDTILECKRVCKNWRISLDDAYFADTHLRRQLLQLDDRNYHSNHSNAAVAAKVGFLFLDQSEKNQLYYREYDDNDEQFSYKKKLTKINHPPHDCYGNIVGSCNGLICLCVTQHSNLPNNVYICNPIIREYVILPSLKKRSWLLYSTLCGFGYNPSTNEYKVVKIYYRFDKGPIGRVKVYTLGSGSGWRKKGEINYELIPSRPGIFLNAALHWLDKEGKILAFDLAEEKFHFLPSSPYAFNVHNRYRFYKLRVLGGCLCVVYQKEFGQGVEIWLLKSSHDMSWNWRREFNLSVKGKNTDKYEPITLAKNGDLLLLYNGIIYRYNLRTPPVQARLVKDLKFSRAIPYMKSFVSLKALGEADAKIIESDAEEALKLESLQPNCCLF